MKIETFILTWNREDTIHLTVKYYQQLGKVTVYDNFSDDATRTICENLGCDVRLFGSAGVLDDGVYLDIKNHCWKNSTCDWVIVVDDDEILYSLDLVDDLSNAVKRGFTIIRPQGFGIFSEKMPKEDWTEILTGVDDNNYSKLCCFSPKIRDINYVYGCHEAHPKGDIRILETGFLLHYRAVGGADRLIKRHQAYEPRRERSRLNMRWGLGSHYKDTVENPDTTRKWFKESLEKSKALF